MKKILVAAVLLSLSGCFYQNVHNGDIQAAQTFCGSRGGINHITTVFDGREKVECQNGEIVHLHEPSKIYR
jgi:hypothetical protein